MSENLRELLREYRDGELSEEEILQRIVRQPFEEHMLGRFDQRREARTGLPEVVLAEGKKTDEVVAIFEDYLDRGDPLMATRLPESTERALAELSDDVHIWTDAGVASTAEPTPVEGRPDVLVVSAGSSDREVALEATVSSRLLGNPTDTLFDVGVAGLTRLADDLDTLDDAGILVVVAGMDGALPSVVGGLARQPLIAVPTSVGYGANFDGLAPLLTMLNACSPGTGVVNIDNGFGAAAMATKIARLAAESSDGSSQGK